MDRTIKETFSALCWTVATPFAYKALKALERNDWRWLVSQDIKPTDYVCPHVFFGDAQVAAYLSKFPDFKIPGIDRKAVAEATFWKAEKQCYDTNERLGPLLTDPAHYGPGIARFLQLWQSIIRKCLGDTPDYTLLSNVQFGPGSTFANIGDNILSADKFDLGYTITKPASDWLPFLECTSWVRHAGHGSFRVHSDYAVSGTDGYAHQRDSFKSQVFECVRGNRFTTVDKNAKTDRGICIEPSANVSFQLAMGKEISKLLKRSFGWDKRTMQGYHRNLARIGSLTGAVATIDLSNASDTVCLGLVRLLLPPAWFRLLDDIRSHFTKIGDHWVKLEKFSSMGNGFTFELETLIFRSLIETVKVLEGQETDLYAPGVDYSVYGDDIICPQNVSKSVVSALRFFGFTPNEQKTFLEGPFRESCGGDYYRGYDVRPHYIRKDVTQPSELIALANGIRRFRDRFASTGWWYSPRTVHIWRIVLDSLPRPIAACRGPVELGDLVIHDDEAVWSRLTRTRNSVRYIRVWRPVANKKKSWTLYRPGVVMACALYGVPDGAPPIDTRDDAAEGWRRTGVVPRIRGSYVSGYRFGRVAFS